MSSSQAHGNLKKYLEWISPEQNIESLVDKASPLEGFEVASAGSEKELSVAVSGLHKLQESETLMPEEQFALEAIVLPRERPVVDIIDNGFNVVETPWTHFGTDQGIRDNILSVIPSIGRIELPDHPAPYGGTGFVVGDGIMMTNRHVAQLFTDGLGQHDIRFKSGQSAGVDFAREINSGTGQVLRFREILMIHPYWDMALLRVDGLGGAHPPLLLSTDHPDDLKDRDIAVIGYPAFDSRNDATLQNRIFRGVYEVKRMSPGRLRDRSRIRSFENVVDAVTHDATSLGGNSGSAVIDVKTGEVIALHFAGLYLKANYAVPTWELASDPRVIDVGVNFESGAQPDPDAWRDQWRAADPRPQSGKEDTRPALSEDNTINFASSLDGNTASFDIPLRISVHLGEMASSAANTELERLRYPITDPNYGNREGFNENFLEIKTPTPTVNNPGDAAALEDGSILLPYQNFSLVMHRYRRLAMFTVSEVDFRKENRSRLSRDQLGGFDENDREKWLTDPRIPEAHQLPDKFYTYDGGAFDKGHIIRRDDVTHGPSLDIIRRANGDTYHTTNCSPQVLDFNRSNRRGIWGKLENFIKKQGRDQPLVVYAGPVLNEQDKEFSGRDFRGSVRIKIPSRYWKIIVSRNKDELHSFGFILEQDLSRVRLYETAWVGNTEEFIPSDFWQTRMTSLEEIQRELKDSEAAITLPPKILSADQFGSEDGQELAKSL